MFGASLSSIRPVWLLIGVWMMRRWAGRLLAIVLTVALVQGFVPLDPPVPSAPTASTRVAAATDATTADPVADGSASLESADPVSHPMVETSVSRLSSVPPKRDGDGGNDDPGEGTFLLSLMFAAIIGLAAPVAPAGAARATWTTTFGAGRPCEAGRCPTGPPAIA